MSQGLRIRRELREQGAKLDLFISTLNKSVVDLSDRFDEADSLLLWNGKPEDLGMNLPHYLRSR
jgi:hypothetical protein